MKNSNQILHGDQTESEENFSRIDHTSALANFFWWHECWRAICLR